MGSLKKIFIAVVSIVAMGGSSLFAQSWSAKIGYVYPAGAKQGSTVRVLVGGQHLRRMKSAVFSGEGVTATVITNLPAFPNLNKEQKYLLAEKIVASLENRMKDTSMSAEDVKTVREKIKKRYPFNILKNKNIDLEGEKLPVHPLLMDLENKSGAEIRHANQILTMPFRFKQKNRQLAEGVLLEVKVDQGAKLGDRVLRLQGKRGEVTNPIIFQIAKSGEIYEAEPNDASAFVTESGLPELDEIFEKEVAEVPFVANGQVMPGDVDRFRFKARKGQKLLIETDARRLIPYLADAVPGWFQAVVAVYDSEGRELAYCDDHFINPDPVLLFEVPANGEYEVEIRDSIYRGREDFVYRLHVSKAKPDDVNEYTKGSVYGDRWTRRAVFPVGMAESDLIPADELALPQVREQNLNDSVKAAQRVSLPLMVNGSISKPGDIDVYSVKVDKASKLAVEVYGRRLGSPLDSVVKVTDKKGKVVAVNDDYSLKVKHLHVDPQGIITHHADSRLVADLPGKGEYFVHISDVRKHGGPRYGYRARISLPMPGYCARVTPSYVNGRKRGSVPLKVYALRRDGYDGRINFRLKDSELFSISGGNIPAGQAASVLTLEIDKKAGGGKSNINLEAFAEIDGKTLSSPVKAADRVMQAFLYEHLVPRGDLACSVRKEKWGVPDAKLRGERPVELNPGKTFTLQYDSTIHKDIEEYVVNIEDAPAGIEVASKLRRIDKGVEFDIKATDAITNNVSCNILLGVHRERERTDKKGKRRRDKWLVRHLPAIPINVTVK